MCYLTHLASTSAVTVGAWSICVVTVCITVQSQIKISANQLYSIAAAPAQLIRPIALPKISRSALRHHII